MSTTPFEFVPNMPYLVVRWYADQEQRPDHAYFPGPLTASKWAGQADGKELYSHICSSLDDFNSLVSFAQAQGDIPLLHKLHDIADEISSGTPVAGPDVFHFEPGMPFFAICWHFNKPQLRGAWECLSGLDEVGKWLKYANNECCKIVVSSLAEYHALMAMGHFAGGSLLLTMKDYEATIIQRDMIGG